MLSLPADVALASSTLDEGPPEVLTAILPEKCPRNIHVPVAPTLLPRAVENHVCE